MKKKIRAKGGIDYVVNHPLVDMKINRLECRKIIKKAGIPQAGKTGCYICPFQRISQWRELLDIHKEIFLKVEALEKNGKKYPGTYISKKPL